MNARVTVQFDGSNPLRGDHRLGCSQAARQQTLTLLRVGSNPTIPAIFPDRCRLSACPVKRPVRGQTDSAVGTTRRKNRRKPAERPVWKNLYRGIAQLVEHRSPKPGVDWVRVPLPLPNGAVTHRASVRIHPLERDLAAGKRLKPAGRTVSYTALCRTYELRGGCSLTATNLVPCLLAVKTARETHGLCPVVCGTQFTVRRSVFCDSCFGALYGPLAQLVRAAGS